MSRLLADRDGITHVALQPNTDGAWWTPILCGGGINLPGPQKRGEPSCPECQRWSTNQRNSVPTDPRKLEAHAGACPYCGASPKDGYVIRNFMGVSFKAECAQGHRWTRQKVGDDAADQPFADETAVEIAPARYKRGNGILAAQNAEATAYAARTPRWWRWIQARLWERKERHDDA